MIEAVLMNKEVALKVCQQLKTNKEEDGIYGKKIWYWKEK